jgi:hypothetical protein
MSASAADLTALPRMELKPQKKPQAQRLVELVADEALFCSTDGETAFATLPVGDHHETWPVRSKGFRRWLVGRFYLMDDKPPAAQALADALGALEAKAQFGGRVHDVHVRLGGASNAVYLDLANAKWEAVEVTADGWRVVADAPVKFRRAKGMLPLPHPVAGGALADLRPFVNVRDDAQWALLVAWLVAAARPRGPYPVLNLGGEHGSAKTTTAEALRRLIDPSTAMLRAEPRDVRDVMIAATNGWVVALDNLSSLEAWLSDALCRLSTGGAFATRQLYTDNDEVLFDAQRPVIINGIEEVITRSDLLDRALLLELPAINEASRRQSRAYWAAFETVRPRLLGALLHAVSVSLAREKVVKLPRLPRMPDFVVIVTAAAPALGWSETYFLDVYNANRASAHEIALDGSPVASAVRKIGDEESEWKGTASELLAKVNSTVEDTARKARWWPSTPRALTGTLRRLIPNLRAVGVEVHFDRQADRSRQRLITIKKIGPLDRPEGPDRPGGTVIAPPTGDCSDSPNGDGYVREPSHSNFAETRDSDDMDGRDDQIPALSDASDEEEL